LLYEVDVCVCGIVGSLKINADKKPNFVFFLIS